MKKKTLLGVAAAAAVGAAGWYLAAGGRKNQIEHIRREAKRLLESVRMEDGAAVLSLRGEKAAAWLSSEPLDRLGVYSVPWRGSARPGVLYTEYLGSGWYAGYACLGWG